MSDLAPVIDVHCHLFNAADIPIGGFVRHVVLKDRVLSQQLADLAVRFTGGAPGFDEDLARIEKLIVGGAEAASPGEVEERLKVQVEAAEDELSDEDKEQIKKELEDSGAEPPDQGYEGFSLGSVRRYVTWAKLFAQSRADLAVLYANQFDPPAELAIPMLVDLAGGVDDEAVTYLDQQVTLFERLSEVSMLGLLPRAPDLRLHPFVSFDPFRILRKHRGANDELIGDVIKDALLNRGFVGVKVYPEMGWRPSGNTAANTDNDADVARRLNAVLDEFFGWCAENSVPVTAHCNHSNFSKVSSERAGYGAPRDWLPVLTDHPELRVNLGHFGGAHTDVAEYTWAWEIVNASSEFPDRLFGDVGCQPVYDKALMATHFRVLAEMAADRPAFARQIMFGTDWYMVAASPDVKLFTSTYRDLFQDAFGQEHTADFMGRNAARFLGFSDPSDANNVRLRQRYADLGAARPRWLAAPEG